MSPKQFILIFSFSIPSFISLSQPSDEQELVSISTNSARDEVIIKTKDRLSNFIAIMALRGYPTETELQKIDSTYSILDSARITLMNGTKWNPTVEYNCKKWFRSAWKSMKMKELTSAETDLLNYMQFSSQWEKKGYPYYLIDNIFFRYSYFDNNNELLMQIEFINKPETKGSVRVLSRRKLIYPDKE